MSEKPDPCPKCGSERVAAIFYGLPGFSEELERKLDAGEVVLGGCVITDDDPTWHCNDCGHQWGIGLDATEWEGRLERHTRILFPTLWIAAD